MAFPASLAASARAWAAWKATWSFFSRAAAAASNPPGTWSQAASIASYSPFRFAGGCIPCSLAFMARMTPAVFRSQAARPAAPGPVGTALSCLSATRQYALNGPVQASRAGPGWVWPVGPGCVGWLGSLGPDENGGAVTPGLDGDPALSTLLGRNQSRYPPPTTRSASTTSPATTAITTPRPDRSVGGGPACRSSGPPAPGRGGACA